MKMRGNVRVSFAISRQKTQDQKRNDWFGFHFLLSVELIGFIVPSKRLKDCRMDIFGGGGPTMSSGSFSHVVIKRVPCSLLCRDGKQDFYETGLFFKNALGGTLFSTSKQSVAELSD